MIMTLTQTWSDTIFNYFSICTFSCVQLLLPFRPNWYPGTLPRPLLIPLLAVTLMGSTAFSTTDITWTPLLAFRSFFWVFSFLIYLPIKAMSQTKSNHFEFISSDFCSTWPTQYPNSLGMLLISSVIFHFSMKSQAHFLLFTLSMGVWLLVARKDGRIFFHFADNLSNSQKCSSLENNNLVLLCSSGSNH